MSQSQDEARAARIQKYKEERRKQLTARTATLFSANVTERRPKKSSERTPPDDIAAHLKSSSELNLNTASTSVPIRTTRTSRLRAAAASQSDTSPSPRKSHRSSSVQSLLEDAKTKSPKNSKLLDRDKVRANRRQSNEKENLKSASAMRFDKEIGAIKTKSKHSINKNILEKDKNNFIMTSPKEKNVDEKRSSKLDESRNRNSIIEEKKTNSEKNENKPEKPLRVKSEEFFNDIVNEKDMSNSIDKFDDLFNNLVVDDGEIVNGIEIKIDDVTTNENGLKYSHNRCIPAADKAIDVNGYVEDSVETNVREDVGGLLGAVCVRKVERFSELLSNLCSPCEADILFEDILVENGIDGDTGLRTNGPECTPPCRRAQPSPRTTSTPKRTPAQPAVTHDATVKALFAEETERVKNIMKVRKYR
ncbi:uncharacterized protein LOC113507610 isoform X3 [Trichoplusia ni]|uniref:Uncharacterized protein LOC113507610 isoform X3 n=1 Tax=Trichoplusia ni TaxID=7111 RepID=A0A7E5X0R7_TRINI|nr:uncharacterized protein LOC113507610 isoform X3 [Trichoplusia ni]